MTPEPLSSLGSRVAHDLDGWLPDPPLGPGRVQALLSDGPRSSRKERWVLAGYALAGAAVAAGVVAWLAQRPLRYETQGLTYTRTDASESLVAKEHAGALKFSEGSEVTVDADSQVAVRAVTHRGARIELDHGVVHARVVHKTAAAWSFIAGPFQVVVVGTGFDLRWNQGVLTVAVNEGAVRVSGCGLPEQQVSQGQATTLQCPVAGPSQATEVQAQEDGGVQQTARPLGTGTQLSLSSSIPAPAVESAPTASASALPAPAASAQVEDWRALASRGLLREAYVAADAAGFESQCQQADARALLDLADGALMAGRTDRARSALMVARSRFPGTATASAAAYRLGSLSFDRTGALGDARAWYEAYLREAPSGGLAREALGRLIEIDVRTGNAAGARARAEQYLKQYPSGPHAELARRAAAP
jgi:transmembrane sensor